MSVTSFLSELGQQVLAKTPTYRVSLAQTPEEVKLAQRLRFEVFNLELHEGLSSAYASGLDQDPFDDICDHLLVVQESTNQVVGTYRMQTGPVAALHLGYYSAQEFDFSPYESIRCQIIELGRACIHEDHRNFVVLNLLWRGIGEYAMNRQARYLIGCSSLTSQDPAVAASAYSFLAKDHLVAPPLRTTPLPAYHCPIETLAPTSTPPPKLLRAYLSIGARICGPPAIDREFKTIDFLTLLDMSTLSPQTRQHFLKS